MCGIVGVLGDRRAVDTVAMMNAIAARGPDDCGELVDDGALSSPLWMGHRRLAIIDPTSAGHQPMFSADRSLAIVFNGEIYNYRELREELAQRGHQFTTNSDTEVILAAYQHYGSDCVRRLKGMFAFAICDTRARVLFLARDRLGEKPLYYAVARDRLLFASSVTALLASGVVQRELDPDGYDSYLTFGSVCDPLTLVHGVSALGAGETLTVSERGRSLRKYWDIAAIASDEARTRTAAVELIAERLRHALSRCMVADVPVGLLLSGGIDSSSNVILLAQQQFRNLQTFSVIFGGADAELDESQYSDLVARQWGTAHHRVAITLDAARELVAQGVGAMDQPTADGLNTYVVCNALHQAGLKVAISGQGADEIFLGYPQRRLFQTLLRAVRLTPQPVKRLLSFAQRFHRAGRDSSITKLMQTLSGRDPLASAYLAQHSIFSYAALCRLRARRRPDPARFVVPCGGADPLDQLSRLQVSYYLKNTLLRDADQMSMSYPVELRAPYLDSDLVEAVLSTPARLRVERDRNKPLLIDAVGPALPRAIWDRPKQGFGLPYARWLQQGLSVADLDGEEIGLDPTAVAEVKEQFRRKARHARLWTLQVLAAWAKQHRMGTRLL